MIEHFSDPFLRDLEPEVHLKIEERRRDWGWTAETFYPRLESWFTNFRERDKPLALKMFLYLDFFSEEKFRRRIADLRTQVDQHLFETHRTVADLLLVVPNKRADSADRHAYEITKAWGLAQDQVVEIAELKGVRVDRVLVFFNDTHGTGNQFLRDIAEDTLDRFKSVFIIALTIGEKALKRFKSELPRGIILPDRATRSVRDLFTSNEVRRIRVLGNKVYPSHPMGYGDAGLLTAYQFQCPNNTLPLIWADGTNNEVDGSAYPWKPLRAYVPKAKAATPKPPAPTLEPPDVGLLDPSEKWRWTDEERDRIAAHIAVWRIATPAFYHTVGAWFDNFAVAERTLALDLFLATSYLDIGRVRDGIRRLGERITEDIKLAGGDSSDIVLVTTGDHKNSVYHYIFDFLREWRMEVDQVRDLGRLGPDAVIDKTLVLFYHTRSSDHFSRTTAGMQTYLERLRDLDPRATFFAAYTTTQAARDDLAKLKAAQLVYLEEFSETVAKRLSKHATVLAAVEASLQPSESRPHAEQLLVAYYFQCPETSSPLLWMDKPAGSGTRPWRPLFRNIRIGR
jgi:hypothetical protein